MLSFTVTDTKTFMAYLLKGDVFDRFTFRQGEIHALASFTLNGAKDADFMAEDDTEPYCLWADIKPFVFQAVRGKKLPKSMKLILSLPAEKTKSYPNMQAVFLNLLFRDGTLLCTTSSSEAVFSLEKKTNEKWDHDVLTFFKKHHIPIEIQT